MLSRGRLAGRAGADRVVALPEHPPPVRRRSPERRQRRGAGGRRRAGRAPLRATASPVDNRFGPASRRKTALGGTSESATSAATAASPPTTVTRDGPEPRMSVSAGPVPGPARSSGEGATALNAPAARASGLRVPEVSSTSRVGVDEPCVTAAATEAAVFVPRRACQPSDRVAVPAQVAATTASDTAAGPPDDRHLIDAEPSERRPLSRSEGPHGW